MDFAHYLKSTAADIDQALETFLHTWLHETAQISPRLLPLAESFASACRGGKRSRGTLVKLGYELTAATYTPEILKPAVAFELFQTAVLAHDDIIDKSDLRRGQPTLHKLLSLRAGDHYGVSQSICLGDVGFFLSMQLLAQSDFPDRERGLAVQSFTHTILQTALGELLDVELPYVQGEAQETDILTIFRFKTAWYTITGPLHLGAILGGADASLLDKLSVFGENLGLAFQIRDDILGVFGRPEEVGKSVVSDIQEGKVTLLINYARSHCTPGQRALLDEAYGSPEVTPTQVEQIKQVFVESGALDYSWARAGAYVERAKAVIPQLHEVPQQCQLLEQLADFIVQRTK
ncbi:polyprenyl synthetase family protein [Anthocerotibacter panamensis]|uniref:polyprenyl synthetase family protein n=1 Tax=Anthocerotibacter panamensis TaxID=2857077 RepID=UPI001C4082DA|nr:polyprenyl synthetase family protein [Anthocerotibacter panamensis]